MEVLRTHIMNSNVLARAIHFAAGIHRDQYDKGGMPYILHCLKVMEDCEVHGETTQVVAVLHDTIEDVVGEHGVPKHALQEQVAAAIKQEFGEEVVSCVSNLTRLSSQDYLESYIPKVQSCVRCKHVKLADLKHNLDILRQPTLWDKDLLRLQKYHMAYRKLLEPWPN